MSAIMSGKPNGHAGRTQPSSTVAIRNVWYSRQSIARDERAQISTSLAEPLSMGTRMWLSMGTRMWYPNTT